MDRGRSIYHDKNGKKEYAKLSGKAGELNDTKPTSKPFFTEAEKIALRALSIRLQQRGFSWHHSDYMLLKDTLPKLLGGIE